MALFCISRYTGTEDVESSVGKSQAADILRRLHEEAELRRKTELAAKQCLEMDASMKSTAKKRQKLESTSNEDVDAGTTEKSQMLAEDSVQEDKLLEAVDDGMAESGKPIGFTILGEFRSKKLEKVRRTLPDWLANPSIVSSDIKNNRVRFRSIAGLDEQSIKLLRANGIRRLFPVQAQVIPVLLSGGQHWGHVMGRGGFRPPDICCSAPTGSGKTLAYVVPVVQVLRSRVVPRVRCLVVVPVGDLASQVYKVFMDYCKGTQLRVGLLTGLKPFLQEQSTLVKRGLRGYQSLVDIVICTPGRLVDHINKTTGFDLTHLRFLVIDEADRMMDEIKQDWLSLVEKAVYHELSNSDLQTFPFPCSRSLHQVLTVENASHQQIPLQKLLFSATLSEDPEKLYQLRLFHPVLFTSTVKRRQHQQQQQAVSGSRHSTTSNSMEDTPANASSKNCQSSVSENDVGEFIGKYTTPVGLTEKFLECNKAQKPLTLMYILREMNFSRILCFTNSVASTHRLYHLMKLIGGLEVCEFSSGLQAIRRSRILKRFAAGKIQLLICSDAMARGIDVVNIDCVVSYDVPRVLATYVHRAGRTARAGQPGTALTLLEKREIFHFKRLLNLAGKTDVKEMKLKSANLRAYVEPVKKALARLPVALQAEAKLKQKRS